MRRMITLAVAGLGLALATPAAAQDEAATETEGMSEAKLAEFGEMMSGLFQTEPLTPEQQARLPQAQAIVSTMMPEGFYGKMMSDIMDKMMRPMMSMFSAPDFVLGARLKVEPETLAELNEEQKLELVEMLDPAHDRRVDAIIGVLTGKMGGMFGAMEDPMREGLSKAYAVRFDERQLADITAFFATPTGAVYAREQMALFSDPQVMQASMQALPAMMSGFGDMESAMTTAMETLPKERAYDDLSAAQRARMAELLCVAQGDLAELVNPPKPMEEESGAATDEM